MSSPLKTKTVEQLKWAFLAVLVVILIFGITLRFGSTSSEANFSVYVDEGKEGGSTNVKLVQGPEAIEAICISDNAESLIMIDGKIAYEGSIINGFRVQKIHPDRVQFEKDGEIFVQTISKGSPSAKSNFSDVPQQSTSSKQTGYGFSKYYFGSQRIAENGTYYGQISETTGRPKTVYVKGYYRKDGTYVRSHYRSPPRR